MSLPEGLTRELRETRAMQIEQGTVLPEAQVAKYCDTFRRRFGPESLARLDGVALLELMHLPGNQDSMTYWLEFKNDDEFPSSRFGSIAGGSAHKFGVFRSSKSGEWVTGSAQQERTVSVEDAILVARTHRDELARGVELLDHLAEAGSDDDYRTLQREMNHVAPSVSDSVWGHKYFSLLFSNKLDLYHVEAWQRYQLLRLLQIPPTEPGRYACAGRFVALARELDMPLHHLAHALTRRNGSPRRYWRIGTRNGDTGVSQWGAMREGRIVSIGWRELGDLSWVQSNKESKSRLRDKVQASFPSTPQAVGRAAQQIFNFATAITKGDVVLPSDGATVLGVGRVTGDYRFDGAAEFAHQRQVEWLDLDDWKLPSTEGLQTTVYELRRQPANIVEVERKIMDAPPPPDTLPGQDGTSTLPVIFQMSGILGRIQAALERKGQVVLYGPPGTGKTHWAREAATKLAAMHDSGADAVRMCTFHPSYGYEDFMEGYRPVVVGEQMVFKPQDGVFKKLCRDAEAARHRPFYLIIDEINRGDIPRIFGELLTLLEKDKRDVKLTLGLSCESFHVPPNVYVIGTMNTADRSIALLDAALRRRFAFVELMPDSQIFGNASVQSIPLGPWLDALNGRVREYAGPEARNLQIGHAYLLDGGRPISQFGHLVDVLRDDIIPLLEEYTYEDHAALEKILGHGMVDLKAQRIREELFEPTRQPELVQALLALNPDIVTTPQAVAAEAESETLDDDTDDDGTDAEGAPPTSGGALN